MHIPTSKGEGALGTGGRQTEALQVFVQLRGGSSPSQPWRGGCSRIHCPGLPDIASAKKGSCYSLFGGFLHLQSGRAVQNGILMLTKPWNSWPPAIHRLKRGKGWENKPVNNKLMWSLFQCLTSHFSHRINDQLKHCIRGI